ncbi:malonyl-coenzyme A:anthocyanin 3-O-glucoside-6''-O-malonyltransferase-like [Curcuma longa]|uniref:malonyl-coenzyme A:anthocyanin 3-O-glucoside-6''-O-malonyltransferase-like n=1 Tax=Curcuma longa TaxID=136217 RepID=UPI003D9E4417
MSEDCTATEANMSRIPSPELRVISSYQVSPPPGTVGDSTLPLTYLDLFWLGAGSVERVFFYPLAVSASHFVHSVVPSLESSLSVALRNFYPLAGKIRHSAARADGYELHYADGDSVLFTVAEYSGDFDDLSSDHPRLFNDLLPLLPELPQSSTGGNGLRLLAVQATLFPERGVAIGITVHHAACDGSSTIQFVSAWATACAGAGVAPPPLIDRSIISDPDDLYSFFYNEIVKGESVQTMMHQKAPADAVLQTFTIGKKQIMKLKKLVTQSGDLSFRCSTLVVAFAYVWVCHVKARLPESNDKRVIMGFAGNLRARLKPPIPAPYFGNCLSAALTETKAGELTKENAVVAAARLIGEAIEAFKEKPFKDVEKWPELSKILGETDMLGVAGSPTFKVYDVDFGWGRPKKVEITSIAKTGAMAVAESREEEGGVEIGLMKPKAEMAMFEKHFNDGLKTIP